MLTVTDLTERLARKNAQLARLKKKGWTPPKAPEKKNASD